MNWDILEKLVLVLLIPVLSWIINKVIDHGERMVKLETLMARFHEDIKATREETSKQTPLMEAIVTALIKNGHRE